MKVHIPIPSATNEVTVRGQALHPVIWHGRQWAVTQYGIEQRDGTYCIAKNRLREGEPGYSWHRHMAEKNWVNLPDFDLAFAIACHVHRGEELVIPEPVPPTPSKPTTADEVWFMEHMVIQLPQRNA